MGCIHHVNSSAVYWGKIFSDENGEAPTVLAASRDGITSLWDLREPSKPALQIKPKAEVDCWTATMSRQLNIIATGYEDHYLRLFDIRKNQLLEEVSLGSGVISIEFQTGHTSKLVATVANAKLFIYQTNSLEKGKLSQGVAIDAHESTVWSVKHNPNDPTMFATTGGNGTLNLYKHNKESAQQLGTIGLVSNRLPAITLDWFQSRPGLVAYTTLERTVGLLAIL